MKAIVITPSAKAPTYTENFPDPTAKSDQEIVISVKAAAIKQLDKSKASGNHYSDNKANKQAKVPGVDGVGILPDGTRVYAIGTTGMMAEKAIADKSKMVLLPEAIDDVSAAALPNAVAGSAMALRNKGAIQAGDTVLINGATGFTGTIAVQIARHYGAGRIIVTGRNEQTLETLLTLGANTAVSISQRDEGFLSRLKSIHNETPIDIVLDYLWGHTAELTLAALKGNGNYTHKTRFISIGSLSGNEIQLSSEILRGTNLHLFGSGLGSWSKEELKQLLTEIIPEMFQLAIDKKLFVPTETTLLKNVGEIWEGQIQNGKRLVVTI